MRDAERVDQRTGGTHDHDVLVVLETRPIDRVPTYDIDVKDDVHRCLESRPRDFSFALTRVPVAEVEICSVVEDRQIDGGSLAYFLRIHVSAEPAWPDAVERLLPARCRGNAAQHRTQIDRDRLHPRIGKFRRPRHFLAVEAPDIATRRNTLVDEPGVLV